MSPLPAKLFGFFSATGFSPHQLSATGRSLPALRRPLREYERAQHGQLDSAGVQPVIDDEPVFSCGLFEFTNARAH